MKKVRLYNIWNEMQTFEFTDPLEKIVAASELPVVVESLEPAVPLDEDLSEHAVLYSMQHLDAFRESIEARDSESRSRLKSVLLKMQIGGNTRSTAKIPADVEIQLKQLDVDFPNFSQVIESCRDHFSLSLLDEGIFSIPPILLIGPAGVGKTEFLQRLARIIGTTVRFVDMASATSPAVLSGSDTFWSNSKEGAVFELLAFGEFMNPILVLDEIDKVDTDRFSPLKGLYNLLEPTTSRAFRDKALPDIPVDASNVVWFATANDKASIDLPILSRFTVFEIRQPDQQQTMAITNSIYRGMLEQNRWGWFFERDLSAEVLEAFGGKNPRQIRKSLMQGLGGAARQRRSRLTREDVVGRLADMSVVEKSIGFLA